MTKLEDAANLSKQGKLNEAIELYKNILKDGKESLDKETAVLKLAELYRDHKRVDELSQFIISSTSILSSVAKAKTAKILKTLLDFFPSGTSDPLQVETVKQLIRWAEDDKRIYLRQSLETRLIALYLQNLMYSDALTLISTLLRELKRLDDKLLLVEVHLLESRVYHSLRNLPKSRASLTSARSTANSIYCPSLLQGSLDLQSGILHADDKDFKTAYSYFYECFESFSSQDDPRAVSGLKYMLMCKIMLNTTDDVHSILNAKLAQKYKQLVEVEAMVSVANAQKNRSLNEFESSLTTFKKQLAEDPIIKGHLEDLYNTLLEQNLCRIIEPYSRVQIAFIAQQVKLPPSQVEKKLSQMILDKLFNGILDQSKGTLCVYDYSEADKTYDAAVDTIKNLAKVVDSLYEKARTL